MEQRGTIERAVAELKVARATLFNWFDREEPPPGEKMRGKLRGYLGTEADFILDGKLDRSRNDVQKEGGAEEAAAPYGDAVSMLQQLCREHFATRLEEAGGDISRLGLLLSAVSQPIMHRGADGGIDSVRIARAAGRRSAFRKIAALNDPEAKAEGAAGGKTG